MENMKRDGNEYGENVLESGNNSIIAG